MHTAAVPPPTVTQTDQRSLEAWIEGSACYSRWSLPGCNKTVALGHKDQAKTSGRMPLWHLPIPLLRNVGTCTPSLWLPAHSVRAHTGCLS
eukprot:1161993-Pelagomonas_calceolata.AAC.8